MCIFFQTSKMSISEIKAEQQQIVSKANAKICGISGKHFFDGNSLLGIVDIHSSFQTNMSKA